MGCPGGTCRGAGSWAEVRDPLGRCWLPSLGWRVRERVSGVPPFQIGGHLVLLALEEGEEIWVAFRFLFHFLLCERESVGSLRNL